MSDKAVLTEYSLSVPKIKTPLDLALVSDIHERKSDDILDLLKKSKPDLILIAGDTFERYYDEESETKPKKNPFLSAVKGTAYYANYLLMRVFSKNNRADTAATYRFLTEASKLAPVFISLGNHDKKLSEDDLAMLRGNGIFLLDNADVRATVGGIDINLGGLSYTPDESWLEEFSKKQGFKLLLCHAPEYFDEMIEEKNIDLTLAGHNHGGQFKLFGKGVLSSRSGFFPKYDSGVFHNRMVVSAGCSNTIALPRWGNPRELVIIHLKPKKEP
jgi:predicted MPP superfamily phosphohydrolase